MIMMVLKGTVLVAIALLVLASPITLTCATKARTPFYVEACVTAFNLEWSHQADNSRLIQHMFEEFIVKNTEDEPIGTMTLDIVVIINMKTYQATATGQFVMSLSSATIEGTITAKVTSIGPEEDIDGKFVGHGDMHVKGDIYEKPGAYGSIIIFDGYSW